MSTAISGFLSNIKANGIARTNRFRVTFNLPSSLVVSNTDTQGLPDLVASSAVSSATNVDNSRLSYMCSAANIPGYTVGAVDTTVTGLGRKMPIDRSTGEFELRFFCSGDMQERKLFDGWIKTIFDTNLKLGYYSDYVTDLSVEQLNSEDDVVYSAVITECYPSVIGPISYDATEMNGIMTFSVLMNYHRLQENDGSVTPNNSVSTSNLFFGDNPATEVPARAGLQLPDAPATQPNYSLYVIDVMKNIDRIKTEISNGLDAEAASRIIRNLQRDLAAATGVGEDITPALTYLNNILGTVSRGSAIGTAQAILG